MFFVYLNLCMRRISAVILHSQTKDKSHEAIRILEFVAIYHQINLAVILYKILFTVEYKCLFSTLWKGF